ncbi:MAG: hypothetical protein JRD89_01150 [Deltaproteobacteria bacterium]|nr:hypothetical protein [Deltaproteobacteria bacterium]
MTELQRKHAEALRKAAEARARGDRKTARKWTRKAREYQEQIASARRAERTKKKKSTKTTPTTAKIIRYNVRDAAGKMHYNVTEAEKDKLLAAGGRIVNTIKSPARGTVYVVDDKVFATKAEAEYYLAKQEGPPPPTKTIDDLVRESRVKGLKASIEEQMRLWAAGEITEEEFLRRKKALEDAHLEWAKGAEERGWKATEEEREEAKSIVREVKIQQTKEQIKQILDMMARGEITHDQGVAAIENIEKEHLEWAKKAEKGEPPVPEGLELVAGYTFVEPPKQYVVTYTENGVEKKKTFSSEDEARAFISLLEQKEAARIAAQTHMQGLVSQLLTNRGRYEVTVTEGDKTTTHTFNTKAEADAFIKKWQNDMIAKYGKPGQTWAQFQAEQRARAEAINKLKDQGVIRETASGYEIVKALSNLTSEQKNLAKQAGFEIKPPEPWLEKLFPILKEIREKAKFREFKPPEEMTDEERKRMFSFAARSTLAMKDIDPETLAARVTYTGAYGLEGAAIGAALTALTTAAPQIGIPVAAAMLLPSLAAISTEKGRRQLVDYVRYNPHAFISETVGGILGSAAVSKLMKTHPSKWTKTQKKQYEQIKTLMEIEEGKPIFKTKKIPTEVADILKTETDPITGEEIVVGRLTEPGKVINVPAARRYGGELFAKLMSGEELGSHLVEETIMKQLTPEQLGYLAAKGYTKPVLSKLTAQEAANLLWKELGVNSPWQHIPEGALRVARGRMKVIGVVRPLSEKASRALIDEGRAFFNDLVKRGVDRQLALQLTQIGMEQGPVNMLVFAQSTGKLSSQMLKSIADSAKILATAGAGSQLVTLKKLGLSDEEALMLQGSLIKSTTPKDIASTLKKLNDKSLKPYIENVDKTILERAIPKLDVPTLERVVTEIDRDTLVSVLPKLDMEQMERVIKALDTKTITEIAPKLTAPRLNLLARKLDEKALRDVVKKLDAKSLQKFDDKTLELIAKKLDIKSLEETLPKLDFNAFSKIFPKLDLDKKEIRDLLARADARTKKNIEDTLVKLDRAAIRKLVLKLNKDLVSDFDKATLREIMEELDRNTLEKFVTAYGAKTVAKAIDKDSQKLLKDLLDKLRGETAETVISKINDATLAEVMAKLDVDTRNAIISKIDKRDVHRIVSKLSNEALAETITKLGVDVDPRLLSKLLSRLDRKSLKRILPKIKRDTLKSVLPHLDRETESLVLEFIDPTLLNEALARVDRGAVIDLVPKLGPTRAAEILLRLNADDIRKIIPKLSPESLEAVARKLTPEMAVEIIPKLEPKAVVEVVPKLSAETAVAVLPLLDEATLTALAPKLTDVTITEIVETTPELTTTILNSLSPRRARRIARRLPPSPNLFRVTFNYDGRDEEFIVYADDYVGAMQSADALRQIKAMPIGGKLERAFRGRRR